MVPHKSTQARKSGITGNDEKPLVQRREDLKLIYNRTPATLILRVNIRVDTRDPAWGTEFRKKNSLMRSRMLEGGGDRRDRSEARLRQDGETVVWSQNFWRVNRARKINF